MESLLAVLALGWLLYRWTRDPLVWVLGALALASWLAFLGALAGDPVWTARNKTWIGISIGGIPVVILMCWAVINSVTK